jgi:hypothetical protein
VPVYNLQNLTPTEIRQRENALGLSLGYGRRYEDGQQGPDEAGYNVLANSIRPDRTSWALSEMDKRISKGNIDPVMIPYMQEQYIENGLGAERGTPQSLFGMQSSGLSPEDYWSNRQSGREQRASEVSAATTPRSGSTDPRGDLIYDDGPVRYRDGSLPDVVQPTQGATSWTDRWGRSWDNGSSIEGSGGRFVLNTMLPDTNQYGTPQFNNTDGVTSPFGYDQDAERWRWVPNTTGEISETPDWNRLVNEGLISRNNPLAPSAFESMKPWLSIIGGTTLAGIGGSLAPVGQTASGALPAGYNTAMTANEAWQSGMSASSMFQAGYTPSQIASVGLSNTTGLSPGLSSAIVNTGTQAATGAVTSAASGRDPLTGAASGAIGGVIGSAGNTISPYTGNTLATGITSAASNAAGQAMLTGNINPVGVAGASIGGVSNSIIPGTRNIASSTFSNLNQPTGNTTNNQNQQALQPVGQSVGQPVGQPVGEPTNNQNRSSLTPAQQATFDRLSRGGN